MAIIETINDPYYFWDWVKHSGSYSNNFTLEGAKALQEYLEQYSDDIGENIEFDPVAWCCEFSEYESIDEYNREHDTNYDLGDSDDPERSDLTDETTVIATDSDAIVVQGF